MNVTIQDSLFFKYEIQSEEETLDDVILLLNLSKKEHLQLYIDVNLYQSDTSNEFSFVAGEFKGNSSDGVRGMLKAI